MEKQTKMLKEIGLNPISGKATELLEAIRDIASEELFKELNSLNIEVTKDSQGDYVWFNKGKQEALLLTWCKFFSLKGAEKGFLRTQFISNNYIVRNKEKLEKELSHLLQ